MLACPVCASMNDDGSAFCEECGSGLAAACPSCGGPVTPGKRFCRSCGAALTELPGPTGGAAGTVPTSHSDDTPTPVAERRVCSVLFCDLVGFTPLSESRDPEEVRELLGRYFEVARTVVDRYGGVVEKFIGDAVMAVWGTPVATEQDAELAVRAALDVVDAVAQLGEEAGATGLAARAGVVTGAVAVTLGATGQGMVAGDAVNTAARVQSAAEAGAVLVDEGTWRVARAAVSFTAVGEQALKGKADPVPLWRADRVLAGVGGAQRVDGLEAPFVGRNPELRMVKELFHACVERRAPRLVSVTGVAGVGKSRLGWEFEKYVDGLADTVLWHRGRCLSYGDGVAFWALAEMVRQRLDIAEEDSPAVAADRLTAGLARWIGDPAERDYIAPRLGQLLGVVTPGPTLGRDELFAGWRLFFERLAAQAPVVLVVENLQHADSGLLDFLEHLLDWARGAPIFVLTLARPELATRRADWVAGRRNATTLSLDSLDDTAMGALLDGLVPGMPTTAKASVTGRAEGIALYAVETVRMLVDRDVVQPIDGVYRLVRDIGELAVPATLQSLLAARLDALEPEARRLVADAAVLGGTFPAEALVGVSGRPAEDVQAMLTELVRREVFRVRADPLSPERGQYAFVQTMLRQVAYDTMSRRERKARHLTVAAHLQTAFADGGEEVAEVVAAHLLDALNAVPDDPDVPELRQRAVEALTRAGERAERTGALGAAANAYAAAAAMLDGSEIAAERLTAAALLERAGKAAHEDGNDDMALEHYGSAAKAYRRQEKARDAARADTSASWSLARMGRLQEARSLVLAALGELERGPDADTVAAHAQLASIEAGLGAHGESDRLSALALARAQSLGLLDIGSARLFTVRGSAHLSAGRPAQAAANYREAVRRAEAAQDGAAAGLAYGNLADSLLSFDPPAAVEAAEAAVAHCRRVGVRQGLGLAAGNLVQALILTGDWRAAEQTYTTVAGEHDLGADPDLAYTALLLHAFRGDHSAFSHLLPLLDAWENSEDPQDLATSVTARAAAALCQGDHAAALAHAMHALGYAEVLGGIGRDPFYWAWPIAADAALAVGNEMEVGGLLDRLTAHAPGDIPPVLRAERLRIAARLLGLRGDPAAAGAFDVATNALRSLGSPYHLALGLLDQAEHLAATGNVPTAQSLADEAHTIADGLGAAPLTKRALNLTASPVDDKPSIPVVMSPPRGTAGRSARS